ncbi:MAG: hypothetical protein FK734_12700, partial [Asgard group archaeon]|nr:hypothetical protein [Asgard group archaeon]
MPTSTKETDSTIVSTGSRTADYFRDFWSKFKENLANKMRNENWSEISSTILMVILLTGFGMFVRLILAYQFRVNWGIGTDPIFWNLNLPFNINNVEIRGFVDFDYYYRSWITAWYESDWYPYRWIEEPNVLDYYSYPPVFLYFLILTWRPGMNELWMAFPMILSDAACAGVVYLILKNIITNKHSKVIAFFGGFLMAIAPINVIYDGVYWLNPGPVTLLTIIAFLFASKKKWWQAFFWLAVATMTKQNALF